MYEFSGLKKSFGTSSRNDFSLQLAENKKATANKLQSTLQPIFANRPPKVKGEPNDPITIVADPWVNALLIGAAASQGYRAFVALICVSAVWVSAVWNRQDIAITREPSSWINVHACHQIVRESVPDCSKPGRSECPTITYIPLCTMHHQALQSGSRDRQEFASRL